MQPSKPQRKRKVTYDKTYDGHPINNGKTKVFGCDVKILRRLKETMDDAIARHTNATQEVRMDFHLPETVNPEDANRVMSDLVGEVVRTLNRPRSRDIPEPRKGIDASYVLVREQNETRLPHFHAVFFWDAGKSLPVSIHVGEIQGIVARKLGDQTLAYECKRGHVLIQKNDKWAYNQAFYNVSYLAKTAQKDASHVREMMGTQLKRRKEHSDN